MNKTLWSDEDGVIAVYEPDAYRVKINGYTLFETPGIHYFDRLNPDTRIISAYKTLAENDSLRVHVITNITDDDPLKEEHETDKRKWTHRHMPFIDIDTEFNILQIPKRHFVESILGRPLCKTDILISDYNKDLIPWIEGGGTAIKYLNGINDRSSFNGPSIEPDWSSETIRNFIISL